MAFHVIFDIAAWMTALITTWLLYRWRFQRQIDLLSDKMGASYFFSISGGGIAGAYLFGSLNMVVSGHPAVARSIIGGLIGAVLMVEIYKFKKKVSTSTGVIFAVPLSLAIAIGRVGCFQAGLDDYTYGTPTNFPWGVDFGDHVLRHPVQLYESFTMLVLAITLIGGLLQRTRWALVNGFYIAVGVYGAQRFAWEFLKPYGSLIGPFNIFHILSATLVVYAMIMLYRQLHESA